MNKKPQKPSQATRLQLELSLNTPTHQLLHPHQDDPQSRGPVPCQLLKQ